MLLSSTPNGISESNIKKVVVVSERNNFNTEVAQLLRTQGVASVEEIQQDFFSSEKFTSFACFVFFVNDAPIH